MKTLRSILGLLTLLSVACGDDDTAPMTDGGTDAAVSSRGAVRGTVSYARADTSGRLTVGVWTTPSPVGPPYEFFAQTNPTFPLDYEITGLPPGTYYLGIVYDIGANNPTIPGPEDPVEFPPAPITIEGGDEIVWDFELVDPET
ncbi:MAG: hypothetical protein KF901_02320 [Myxococcales bacterium]|nr:hypothetical protein [Myxococcales bacterium]